MTSDDQPEGSRLVLLIGHSEQRTVRPRAEHYGIGQPPRRPEPYSEGTGPAHAVRPGSSTSECGAVVVELTALRWPDRQADWPLDPRYSAGAEPCRACLTSTGLPWVGSPASG